MAQFLIRDLDKPLVDLLKKRAKAAGRSLEAHVRVILEEASNQMIGSESRQLTPRLRGQFKSDKFPQ